MASITTDVFGQTKDGTTVNRFTMTNGKGMSIKVIEYGAVITEINIPDKNGKISDINLGYDNMEDYQRNDFFLGAIIGRVANKIAGGQFTLDGKTYNLFINNGPTSSHGGEFGFHHKMWKGEVKGNSLTMTRTSPDGEEHYPGDLTVTVTYTLTEENALDIDYQATTTKPTLINLTSHLYFNLAGHDNGALKNHVLTLHGSKYLPVDENKIPTGELRSVEGSDLDLRQPVDLEKRVQDIPGGLDHTYCLDHDGSLKMVARLEHEPSGRFVEVSTTEPSLQAYSSFYLDDTGKGGAKYGQYAAMCLEAQHFPDAIHQPTFPNTVLHPGETYTQKTVYKFGLLS